MVLYGKWFNVPGGQTVQFHTSTTIHMSIAPIKDVLNHLKKLNKFEQVLGFLVMRRWDHYKIVVDRKVRSNYGKNFPLTCLDNNNIEYYLFEFGDTEDS